jgi:hypothetical protein
MNNIQKSIDYINKTYDKLSYFDLYGGSVFICIVLISLLVLYMQYVKISMNIEPVKRDWPKHRCNPIYMPFAGYIMRPKGVGWVEFAGNNANYCINDMFTNIMSNFTNPIKFILYPILGMWKIIFSILQSIRKMFLSIRDKLKQVVANLMNRVSGFVIVIQQIIISMRDLFAKVQGVAVAGLYTVLGSYYTLKSALGAVMELCIIFLVTMAVIIVGFWMMPWTWGIAAGLTAVFISISIPLIVMTVWLSKIMNIQTSRSPPGKPGRPSCFSGDSRITLKNGETIHIREVKIGDVLKDGGVVTARMKVKKTPDNIIGLISPNVRVTGCHYVYHEGSWIKSLSHPNFSLFPDASDIEYLYCLNVSTKKIHMGGLVFSDWDDMIKTDETYGFMTQLKDTLYPTMSTTELHNPENIHKYFDGGLDGMSLIDTTDGSIPISKIKVGAELCLGNTVIGVVKIYAKDLDQMYYNVSGRGSATHVLRGGGNLIYKTSSDCELSGKSRTTLFEFIDKKEVETKNKSKVLYHLLTETGEFKTDCGLILQDYNSCLDHFE